MAEGTEGAEGAEGNEVDLFDTILFAEEGVIQSGRSDGEREGGRTGTLRSFSEGLKEGGELASEIGFYSGVCEGLIKNRTQFGDRYTERTWSRVVKLSDRVLQLETNVKEEGIGLEESVTHIRNEFKVVVSKFKLQIKFKKPELNEL